MMNLVESEGEHFRHFTGSGKGGELEQIPAGLRIREFPKAEGYRHEQTRRLPSPSLHGLPLLQEHGSCANTQAAVGNLRCALESSAWHGP